MSFNLLLTFSHEDHNKPDFKCESSLGTKQTYIDKNITVFKL